MSTYTSEPGTRLAGRYRLVEHTATGNGWIMWKAQDETLARLVSVLTFAPGFPRIPEVVTAARAASRLTDTRLAQVFDVEDEGEGAYVVMEWVSGDTLGDLVADGPLDPGHGCALVGEAAKALAAAHAAGQAHLLLTPRSLCWTRSSGIKITGLGIDAALAGAGLANASDPALTDTRDLAGLLYAALTGYWPCESVSSLAPAPTTDGEVCTPRQVSPEVPAAIDAVVTRALLQRPVRQAAPILTPDAFADELARVAPPVPLPEPAPPVSYDPGPPAAYEPRPPSSYQPASYNGYGGGYPQNGGFPQSGGFPQANGYPSTAGFRPDPNDPSTWDHHRRRQPERGAASRAMVSVVVVLVLAAVAAAAWVISNSLHKSGGNRAGGSPSSSSSGSQNQNATVLTPQSGRSFNVLGTSPTPEDTSAQDNPITGASPAWQTQQYDSANFGGLKKGDGYLIDMGQDVKASSVEVDLAPGTATAQIYVSDTTSTTPGNTWPQPGYTAVTQPAQVSGDDYTFNISTPTSGRYIIIWFTSLPSGTNQETISKVTVKGTAG